MIETNYFLLDHKQFRQFHREAQKLGVSLDYFMFEFVDTSGPDVVFDGENWVEVED